MPSFTRISDALRLDLAQTPEEKAYAKGRIDGRQNALNEILFIAMIPVILIGIGLLLK